MQTKLQTDCQFTGPLGTRTQQAMQSLAESISQELGLLWKTWTVPLVIQETDGIDLFTDTIAAQVYLDMHSQRLTASGEAGIQAQLFSVNSPFSHFCKGPIQ